MAAATISVDEFQALEQKVLQTVELIKKERDARAAAEARCTSLETQVRNLEAECSVLKSERKIFETEHNAAVAELGELKERLNETSTVKTELDSLHREREAVRLRVERMVAQMDELFA